ncbi:MAG: SpoVA/SpoVAEb family sporulation membrane protein [Firmicutes bacterium]|nr:SpoVA/SpoVAEb family sporulation membrane protein [Bacillota bacterium]
MVYLKVFLVGGLICMIAQVLLNHTKLTAGRIMVIFVLAGVLLEGVGVYQYIVDFAEAGARVPILGFGHSLAKGAIADSSKDQSVWQNILGTITGGKSATAAGIAAAIFFSYLFALMFNAKTKKL